MSDTPQADNAADSGSDAPTCSPSSLTPETDALVAADLHHLEDDETCPASAYWRMVELARTMERERDEWHCNAMLKLAVKMLSCMWCGELVHAPKGFVSGSPLTKDQRAQAYREHVSTCPAHPIRDTEKELEEARSVAAYWRDVATGEFAKSAELPWEKSPGNAIVEQPGPANNH